MGRTQGSGQSRTQEERGGLPQSRLGATGVVRGQRPGGGWASPKAQTRVVVTGGKTKHASGGRRWRAAVAGDGDQSFSSDRFSRPVTQEARPPADGTGRGRQRSEDRGGGQEGGWEMRIARTVKGPLEIGRDALYLRPVMAAARLLGRLCGARAWGTAWAGGWRSPGSAVRCERGGSRGLMTEAKSDGHVSLWSFD